MEFVARRVRKICV